VGPHGHFILRNFPSHSNEEEDSPVVHLLDQPQQLRENGRVFDGSTLDRVCRHHDITKCLCIPPFPFTICPEWMWLKPDFPCIIANNSTLGRCLVAVWR